MRDEDAPRDGDDADAAGDRDSDRPSAFELLSDETRAGILEAFAEHARETDGATFEPLGFEELRRRVGVRDSGKFNYHLDRLRGRFVEKTDAGGYVPTVSGFKLAAAIVSEAYADRERGPTALDRACPLCGTTLEATYDSGAMIVGCANGHEIRNELPPGALDDRSMAAAAELLFTKTFADFEYLRTDVCPLCYGSVERRYRAADDDGPYDHQVAGSCDRCSLPIVAPLRSWVVSHPAVVSFYHDHGIDLRGEPSWLLELWAGGDLEPIAGADGDGREFAYTLSRDGDALRLRLDETARVLASERR